MKKNIFTSFLTLLVILFFFYLIWFFVANQQEKIIRKTLNKRLGFNLEASRLKTSGFPARFFTEVNNIEVDIKNSPFKLSSSKIHFLKMAYNLSKTIVILQSLKLEASNVKSMNIIAGESRLSISGQPHNGQFKLISETNDIKIEDSNESEISSIGKILIAIRSKTKDDLELYIELEKLILGDALNNFFQMTELIQSQVLLNGSISSDYLRMDSDKLTYQNKRLLIESFHLKNKFLKLVCEGNLEVKGKKITTKKRTNCILAISPKIFNLINTNNPDLEKYIYLLKAFISLKLLSGSIDFIEIPFSPSIKENKLSVNGKTLFNLEFE